MRKQSEKQTGSTSFYLRSVAKKSRSVAQTLKKEGVLTLDLEMVLKNCTTADEIDHVVRQNKFINSDHLVCF